MTSFISSVFGPITADLVTRRPQNKGSIPQADFTPTFGKRDDLFYDENLQLFDPKDPSHADRKSISQGPMNPAMVLDIVSKPTAVIIGAGLPGVHMAYELARRGFQVDVLDAQSAPACGNTAFMFPVAGLPFSPAAFDRFSKYETVGNSITRMLPKCSDPWMKLSSSFDLFENRFALRAFSRCERGSKTPFGDEQKGYSVEQIRENVISTGTQLSKDSARKIRQMLQEHPELRSAVVTQYRYGSVAGRSSNVSSTLTEKSLAEPCVNKSFWSKWFGFLKKNKPTNHINTEADVRSASVVTSSSSLAHSEGEDASGVSLPMIDGFDDSPITIMPLMWTQNLASVCASKYGVRFIFDSEVINLGTNGFTADTFVNGLIVATPHAEKEGGRPIQQKYADVYVIAAGVTTPGFLSLLVETSPLIVTESTAAIFETKRKSDVEPKKSSGISDVLRDAISSSSVPSLRGLVPPSDGFYFFPNTSSLRYNRSEVPFSKKTSEASGMVVGGQTFVNTVLPMTKKGLQYDVFYNVLDRLFANISSNSHTTEENVALVAPNCDMKKLGDAFAKGIYKHSDSDARSFHCYSFYKTITPDGLPVASRVGPFFNTFVIGGFGDNSPAMGPAAAERLGHLIANPRDETLKSPLPIERYDPTNPSLKPLEKFVFGNKGAFGRKNESLIQSLERNLSQIGVYFDNARDRIVENLIRSSAVSGSVKNMLYVNFLTAESEVKLTGRTQALHLNMPLISPETNLAPPTLPKELMFDETVVKDISK